MPELPGHRVCAVHQLPVQQHADTDAFRHGDGNEVSKVFIVPAEPDFAERAGVRRVLHVDGQPRRRLEHLPQVHVPPAEVRREHEPSGRIDSSGQADANPFAHHPRMRGAQAGNGSSHCADEHGRISGRRKRPLRLEPRVHVCQPHRRRLWPEVHAHDARALDVEVQKPRPPPARQPADGALGDPPLLDQLVDDGRDGAALKPRTTGQVRPGHRLVMPEEVQRDPPVNLPRGLARGDLEVRRDRSCAWSWGNCIRVDSRQSSVVSHSPQSESSVPVGSPSRQSQSAVPVDSRPRLKTDDCD